ncbi:MAG: hypothetical protein ACK56W_00475 [Pirellula sp.]|jgi:hypothetical protein|nr:hypothetical protein [Pirellula sp.]
MKSSVVIGLLLCCVTLFVSGCDSKPPMAQISGTVTFKGKPIPAGNVMFTPDVNLSGGQIRMFNVKDGAYDSTKDPSPGLLPGKYEVTIQGYDGKQIPNFFQGKQIFNAVKEPFEVPAGTSKKDFVVPDSAGVNVKIFETADF